MQTGFGVAAELADDHWLLVSDFPGSDGSVFGLLFVPSYIFVGAEDIEGFAERIVNDFGVGFRRGPEARR